MKEKKCDISFENIDLRKDYMCIVYEWFNRNVFNWTFLAKLLVYLYDYNRHKEAQTEDGAGWLNV